MQAIQPTPTTAFFPTLSKQVSQVSQMTRSEEVTSFLIENYKGIIDQLDLSAASILKYKKDAKDFINFVKGTNLHLNTYRQYKKHLYALTTISTKTKNYKLVAAKALLVELYSRYRLLNVDLTAGVKSFKVNQGHTKDGLNEEEVKSVKTYIDQVSDREKKSRLQAMFYLLTFQGLRQFEVCHLTVEDLKLYDKQILVRGKGRDDKEAIDLHPMTVKALKKYLHTFQIKSGYLFFSLSNNRKGKLSERSLRRLFAEVFAAAGIEGRSVHGLRHYFVTAMLESKSFDLFEVQKFSRHRSIQTLQKYDDRKKKRELLPDFYAVFGA